MNLKRNLHHKVILDKLINQPVTLSKSRTPLRNNIIKSNQNEHQQQDQLNQNFHQYNNNFQSPFSYNHLLFNPFQYTPNQRYYHYYDINHEQKWMIKKIDPQIRDHKIIIQHHVQLQKIKQLHNTSKNEEQKIQTQNNQNYNQNQKQQIPFKFKYSTKLSQNQQKVIFTWLKTMFQQIFSHTFKKLLEQNLDQSQFKVFASKNILLNIKSFSKKLSKIFSQKDQKGFNHKNTQKEQQVFKMIRKSSKKIVQSLKNKFPQADAKQGSNTQLKNIIKNTDKSMKDQYDLFFNYRDKHNKPKIKFQKSENIGDNQNQTQNQKQFFSEIMETLNYIVSLASQPFSEGNLSYSNFDAFKEMLTTLFTNPEEIKKNIEKLKLETQKNQKNNKKEQQKNKQKTNIDIFKCLFSQQNKRGISKEQENQSIFFKIGAKIPEGIPLFSQSQIKNEMFKINDGSILRILTKWAEQLRQKFSKRLNINNNHYGFKNINGKIKPMSQINQDTQNQIIILCQKLEKDINSFYEELQQHFSKIENQIINQTFQMQQLNSIDTNVGIISAETQMVLGNYLIHYINQLIKGLVQISASMSWDQDSSNQQFDLDQLTDIVDKFIQFNVIQIQQQMKDTKKLKLDFVTLKIGDLMRGKCLGSVNEIVNIYQCLSTVSKQYPKVIQIVRIKNRLQMKNKDVLINFMFMGKFQCQLQLSVNQKIKQKNKLMNEFNHFIYELERAQFGVISQCCSIIAKNDPAAKLFQYPHQYKIKENIENLKYMKQSFHKEKQKLKPFLCFECKKIKRNQNPNYFDFGQNLQTSKRSKLKKVEKKLFSQCCNQCIQKRIQKIQQSNSNQTNDFLKNIGLANYFKIVQLKEIQSVPSSGILISKINSKPIPEFFYSLNYPQNSQCLYIFTENGQLVIQYNAIDNFKSIKKKFQKFYIFTFEKRRTYYSSQTKSFIQQTFQQILKDKKNQQFETQKIRINLDIIKNLIKKQTPVINLSQFQFLQKTLQEIKRQNINTQCIEQVHLNGNLKYKSQTLKEILNIFKVQNLKEINLNQITIGSVEQEKILINSSKIQQLVLKQNQIENLNMVKCQNLKYLDCTNNLIKQINLTQFPALQYLFCTGNQHLQKIYAENQNTTLKTLTFFANQSIQQINISMFSNLQKLLIILSGKLKKIYASEKSNKSKLKILTIFNNQQLQDFNMSQFPSLQQVHFFGMEKLEKIFSPDKNNQLKIIKISGSKQIKQFNINDFPLLQQLNFSQTQDLKELSCKQKSNNLKKLICYKVNNQNTLNIKQFPMLQELIYLQCQHLQKILVGQENKNLKVLSVQKCSLNRIQLIQQQNDEVQKEKQQINQQNSLENSAKNYLQNNKISQILPNLQQFSVQDNKLKSLIISKLVKLKKIKAGYMKTVFNFIEISQMKQLTQLYLYNSTISTLVLKSSPKLLKLISDDQQYPILKFQCTPSLINKLKIFPRWIYPYKFYNEEKIILNEISVLLQELLSISSNQFLINLNYQCKFMSKVMINYMKLHLEIIIDQQFQRDQNNRREIQKDINQMLNQKNILSVPSIVQVYNDQGYITKYNFDKKVSMNYIKDNDTNSCLSKIVKFQKIKKYQIQIQKNIDNLYQESQFKRFIQEIKKIQSSVQKQLIKLKNNQKNIYFLVSIKKLFKQQYISLIEFRQIIANIIYEENQQVKLQAKHQQHQLIQNAIKNNDLVKKTIQKFKDFKIKVQTKKKCLIGDNQLQLLKIPLYIQIPKGKSCSNCQMELQKYYFWCKWDQQPNSFRCIKCIQLYDQQNKRYIYENNCILTNNDQNEKIDIQRLGHNLRIFEDDKGKQLNLACKLCQNKFICGEKPIRYLCLQCIPQNKEKPIKYLGLQYIPQNQDYGQDVNICSNCLMKNLNEQKLIISQHEENHAFLRIVNNGKSQKQY